MSSTGKEILDRIDRRLSETGQTASAVCKESGAFAARISVADMHGSTETTITFEGDEYDARIEFVVTDWGAKAIIDYVNGGDPGWGPEWDVEAIWLTPINEDGEEGDEFLAKGVRFAPLYNSEEINDAIYTRVTEMEWEGV